jgi:type II secretory pathway component PulL
MNVVALYSRFEASSESAREYENALQDVAVAVEFECADAWLRWRQASGMNACRQIPGSSG